MESKPNNLTIPEMLAKLNLMYDRKDAIETQVALLHKEYTQLEDDIDMAQIIVMHQSNKQARKKNDDNFFG